MAIQNIIAHGLAHEAMHLLPPVTNSLEYASNSVFPTEVPSVGELFHLAIHGWIDESALPGWCLLKGVSVNPAAGLQDAPPSATYGNFADIWNRVYYAHQELPTVTEYLKLSNRFLREDPEIVAGLRRWGYLGDETRKEVANLRYEIPTTADLVRFSIRHVFEPQQIVDFGFDDEFNCTLDFWHKLQGLDYPIFTGPFAQQYAGFLGGCPPNQQVTAQSYQALDLEEPTWARAFWWAHWVLPSPSQGYLMWQRLNPARSGKWDAPEMKGVNFGFKELTQLLRGNDYPPKYRPLLAAISRPIPGLSFARNFRATKVYDFNDLLEWAKRQGYGPQDAQDIATSIDKQAKKQESKQTSCQACGLVDRLYKIGVIDSQQLQQYYTKFGLQPQEATDRAALLDLDLEGQRASKLVTTLRGQFLSGNLTVDQVRGSLNSIGISPGRATQYIDDWDLEKDGNIKHVQASKLVDWGCKGIISQAQLVRKLQNLGFATDEINGMVAESAICQLNMQAKALSSAAKQAKQVQSDLEAAVRKQAQQFRETQRALAAHGSPTLLRKWYCEGAIAAPELTQRLRFLGWPDIDIARLVSDCKAQSKQSGSGPGGGGAGGVG
jgi:hypothetical protein